MIWKFVGIPVGTEELVWFITLSSSREQDSIAARLSVAVKFRLTVVVLKNELLFPSCPIKPSRFPKSRALKLTVN